MSPEMKARLRKEYLSLGGSPNTSMGGVSEHHAAMTAAAWRGAADWGWQPGNRLLEGSADGFPDAWKKQRWQCGPCSRRVLAWLALTPPYRCHLVPHAELLSEHHPGHLLSGGAQLADGRHLTAALHL